jgi:hypothetical protein
VIPLLLAASLAGCNRTQATAPAVSIRGGKE